MKPVETDWVRTAKMRMKRAQLLTYAGPLHSRESVYVRLATESVRPRSMFEASITSSAPRPVTAPRMEGWSRKGISPGYLSRKKLWSQYPSQGTRISNTPSRKISRVSNTCRKDFIRAWSTAPSREGQSARTRHDNRYSSRKPGKNWCMQRACPPPVPGRLPNRTATQESTPGPVPAS